MMRNIRRITSLVLILVCICTMDVFGATDVVVTDTGLEVTTDNGVYEIPAYSGEPTAQVNSNNPLFTDEELHNYKYEHYTALDSLGRVGEAEANLDDAMRPTGGRGSLKTKPTGWIQYKYATSIVSGGWLYNRSHLIGWQLTGQNDNPLNLMTGTRYFNVTGMLPFENAVAKYIKTYTDDHITYRITPVFVGNNLLAEGVIMEAETVLATDDEPEIDESETGEPGSETSLSSSEKANTDVDADKKAASAKTADYVDARSGDNAELTDDAEGGCNTEDSADTILDSDTVADEEALSDGDVEENIAPAPTSDAEDSADALGDSKEITEEAVEEVTAETAALANNTSGPAADSGDADGDYSEVDLSTSSDNPEDQVNFCVFIYNVQPGIFLNYATGANHLDGEPDVIDISNANEATVKLSATTYAYTGTAKEPTVTVSTKRGTKLTDYDYTVAYASGRKNVGTYSVTVNGKGNCTGTIKKSFVINPKAPAITSLTKGKKSFTVKWRRNLSQCNGYIIQYSRYKNFKSPKSVMVRSYTTSSRTVKRLKARQKYYVRVRAYKTVNGKTYYSNWSSSKYTTTK